jgi:hypothetical protein
VYTNTRFSRNFPQRSIPGIIAAAVSVVVMPLLARAERRVVVVDPVGLVMVPIIAKEGIDGLRGKACCHDCGSH